jgi:hypothetical protein
MAVGYNPHVDELSHCANKGGSGSHRRSAGHMFGYPNQSQEQHPDGFLTGTLSFTCFTLGFTRRIYAE